MKQMPHIPSHEPSGRWMERMNLLYEEGEQECQLAGETRVVLGEQGFSLLEAHAAAAVYTYTYIFIFIIISNMPPSILT